MNLPNPPTASPVANPTAELRGLKLSYGKQQVLKTLDWQLQPGQVVGLLGRNGAGKTTLLEAMLGLRDLQGGSVQLFGEVGPMLSDAVRARIGYVPQHSNLFEGFTPDQLLAYFRSFYSRWNTAKVDGLMSRWDIPRGQPIARLSGGQQQRLSIIRALAHEPDLLVLDEPVASLDPAGRRDFLRELVDQVLDRGTTVVLSTHILSDLERVAFNVAFMRDGKIGVQAPLDELLENTRQVTGDSAYVRALVARHGAQVLQRRALTLPLVPWVVQDWASVRPPEAYRATLKLVLAMLVPVSAWAAMRWLDFSVELIAVISVGACWAVLRIRWLRLARFGQPLPVGRSA